MREQYLTNGVNGSATFSIGDGRYDTATVDFDNGTVTAYGAPRPMNPSTALKLVFDQASEIKRQITCPNGHGHQLQIPRSGLRA